MKQLSTFNKHNVEPSSSYLRQEITCERTLERYKDNIGIYVGMTFESIIDVNYFFNKFFDKYSIVVVGSPNTNGDVKSIQLCLYDKSKHIPDHAKQRMVTLDNLVKQLGF